MNPTTPRYFPEVQSQLISSVETPKHSTKLDYSTYNRFTLIPEVESQFISSVATPIHSKNSAYNVGYSGYEFSNARYPGHEFSNARYPGHEKASSISSIATALHSCKIDDHSYKPDYLSHYDKISLIADHSNQFPAYYQRSRVQQPERSISSIATAQHSCKVDAHSYKLDHLAHYDKISQIADHSNQIPTYYQRSRAQQSEMSISSIATAPHSCKVDDHSYKPDHLAHYDKISPITDHSNQIPTYYQRYRVQQPERSKAGAPQKCFYPKRIENIIHPKRMDNQNNEFNYTYDDGFQCNTSTI